MNAEGNDPQTEEAPEPSAAEEPSEEPAEGRSEDPLEEPAEAEGGLPARRGETSVGRRVRSTLAAADAAVEEILSNARNDAREHVERVERAAIERTNDLQRQTEVLLAQAAQLTQQAQALGEATRELTSTMRAELVVEAQEVTEIELTEQPRLEPVRPEPAEESDAEALIAGEPLTELGPSVRRSVPPPEPAVEERVEPEERIEPAPEVVVAADADLADRPEAIDLPEVDERLAVAEPAEEAPEPPKKRRGLFARLRRERPSEPPGEPAETSAFAQRVSEELDRSKDEGPTPEPSASEASVGARLLARQMLTAGLDEAEVERRLRDELQIEDPRAVLESLYRPRMGWNDDRREDQ